LKSNGKGKLYVARTININGKYKKISMHRQIIGKIPIGKEVDHINHNGFDNRRCNLRICSRSQNAKNSKIRKNNTSGYNGVTFDKRAKKWRAQIWKDNCRIHIGLFEDKKIAARAVDKKAVELFGEFAVLNFCRPTLWGREEATTASSPTTTEIKQRLP